MQNKGFSLLLGLAMVFALAGCTQTTAPSVTPTPSPMVTPSTIPNTTENLPNTTDGMPGNSPAVGDTAPVSPSGTVYGGAGTTVRSTSEDIGRAVQNAVH